MAKGKNKSNKGDQGSVIIKHVEIDGRSIAIMSEAGTVDSNQRCESDREELEEEQITEDNAAATDTADPPSARQNASAKTGIAQCETSTAGEIREAGNASATPLVAHHQLSPYVL
ncbi:hypothetical protein Acr_24g0001510 [Actinidia rufa]|uniref:Uncharacterized protein n=1 Tax=Actinidia rufa TaxID=165716 RepID=A0A7J0GTB3_9ERIC|nr:hypothetical protein Acr_24g0001510 [Actinidia rufa]